MVVKVIDSIMGSGKTKLAIERMNKMDNEKFLYITPFLDEVERVKRNVKCKVYEPKHNGVGKFNSLKKLVTDGYDVASTHANLSFSDEEFSQIIEAQGYNLILDETMNVLETFNLTKDDFNLLLNNYLKVNDDNTVEWINDKEYVGEFEEVKRVAQKNRLILMDNTLLLWRFPIDIFKSFKTVTLLTYNFEGSLMKPYFELYKQDYELKSVKDGVEVDYYKSDKVDIKNRINIYNKNNLNEIGRSDYSLSKSWYSKSSSLVLKILSNNTYNFFTNICNNNGSKRLWTTFKTFKPKISKRGFKAESTFCPIGMRATNKYMDRTDLVYLVNNFINPYIKRFFTQRGIKLNEDLFALDLLLQWIWRSGIREGKTIELYIPSKRMRTLLQDWLDDKLL